MEKFYYIPKANMSESLSATQEEVSSHSDILAFLTPGLNAAIERFCPKDLPVQLNHAGVKKPEDFVDARDFLEKKAGIASDELDRLFTAEGKWKEEISDETNIFDKTPSDAAAYMTTKLLPVYAVANKSLDTSLPNGFNRHGIDHVASVYKDGQYILHQAQKQRNDIDEKSFTVNAVAAIGHDAGNILSRFTHAYLSVPIVEHFVPEVLNEKNKWEDAQEAILLHDEPVLKQLLKKWDAIDTDGKINPDAAVQALESHLKPEALALLVADKSQFGRDRVSEKTDSLEGIEKDPHILANLLIERTTPEVSEDGQTYTMRLAYNPMITEKEQLAWAARPSKRPEYSGNKRVHVDTKTHQQFKEKGIPYSLSIEKKWSEIFEDRITILMAATFALFPKLQNFKLEFLDPSIPTDKNKKFQDFSKRSYLFKRDQLAQSLQKYKNYLTDL